MKQRNHTTDPKRATRAWLRLAPILFASSAVANPIDSQQELLFFANEAPNVITSTLRETRSATAPSTIFTVSGDEVRRWGIRRLSELVDRLVPGAAATQDSDDVILSFRGIASDTNLKVLMLIDGHNHNSQWNNGANPAEVELSLVQDIKAVEVITGPGSALYGSGATIGVINIITKSARDPKNRGAEISASAGSGDTRTLDVTAAGESEGNVYSGFSFGDMKSSGLGGGINGPARINRYPHNQRQSARVEYKDFQLLARNTRSSRSFWNLLGINGKPTMFTTYESFFLDLRQDVFPTDHLRVTLNVNHDAHQVQRHDFVLGTKLRGVGERFYGGKATGFYDGLDKHDIVVGVEYRYEEFGKDADGANFNYLTSLTTAGVTGLPADPYARRSVTPFHRNTAAFFAQDIISFNEKLTLLLGGRYDYAQNHRPGAQQGAATPRAALILAPDDKSVVKLMYSQGFRQPQGTYASPDAFSLGGVFTGTISKPEEVVSYELAGSRRFFPWLTGDLNLFHNAFNNIHGITAGVAGTSGRVDFQGFETVLTGRFSGKFFARAIHQHVELGSHKNDPAGAHTSPDKKYVGIYPEDLTKILADLRVTDKLSLNANLNVVWRAHSIVAGNPPTGPYSRLNANIVYEIGSASRLILSGYNLTDDKTLVPTPSPASNPYTMTREAGVHYNLTFSTKF